MPVNTLMSEDDYRFMLTDSGARMLVVSQELYPKFEKLIAGDFEFPRDRVTGETAPPLAGPREARSKASPTRGAYRPPPTTRDDIAFWLYTSGSTGKPKAAVHVHADLKLTNDLYAAPILGLTENDVVLLGGKALLRLRARQCDDVSALGRRHHGAAAGAADARRGGDDPQAIIR